MGGYSLVVAHGLLIVVVSLAVEHRLMGFSSCSTTAQWLWFMGLVAPGMWDLPGPGIEPMSPALAGRFLNTVPPGKSLPVTLKHVKRLLYV